MRERRREAVGVGALAVVAVGLWAALPSFPNYDAYYHLVWGRELLDGHAPGFEAYQAPTQHPLYLALAAVLGLVGEDADRLLVLTTALSLVALVHATYRLGRVVFGTWPGLTGAVFVGTSVSFLLYAARGYVDVPFLALVAWAAVLVAERPERRGRPLALLALAGLLRPEAWLLGGGLALWRPLPGRRGRAASLGLAVVAPATWCLVDALVTGDPLHSVHATSDLADELGRDRGVEDLPGAFVSFLGGTLRPPVAALGAVGVVLAWRLRVDRARLAVPLALLGAGALTFLLTGLAGLSILPRYLGVPAVALALFAGYALFGFTGLPPGPWRRRWAQLAGVAAAVGLGAVAVAAPDPGRVTGELRFTREVHRDLAALVRSPAVRAARRCGPITLPNYRLVPDTRWILDAPAGAVGSRSARRRPYGVALFVLGEKALDRFGFAQGTSPRNNVPDRGYAPIARRGKLAAYASCPPPR